MDKKEKVDDILNLAKQFVGYFEEVEEKSIANEKIVSNTINNDKDISQLLKG